MLNYDTNTISLVLCVYIILFAFTSQLRELFIVKFNLVFKQAGLILPIATKKLKFSYNNQVVSVGVLDGEMVFLQQLRGYSIGVLNGLVYLVFEVSLFQV